MRPEANSLDLNNLPEDYTRDGKQTLGDTSSSAERETETLNKARQLVFSNDVAPPHINYVSSGGFHQASSSSMDEAFRSIYPAAPSRMFPTTPPPPQPQYGFPSPPHSDYYMLSNSCYAAPPPNGSFYTCIGAPVAAARGVDGDSSMHNQDHEGLGWARR
ncbi:hypothetical protein SASPL_133181 [Salvia splendens]|uniref:Uncharacterized protein n=1 Tax=Salvia splendens TaxID=180675 RepID=A0A8X8X4E6_SALSN|nr:hypothetical protein SASPL_133181 [Salvia splendens]